MDRGTVVTHLDKDSQLYIRAVKELMYNPVEGSSGTYHVKNGMIHYGYEYIPIKNFATSAYAWEIFH
jgi:hypothetical protein